MSIFGQTVTHRSVGAERTEGPLCTDSVDTLTREPYTETRGCQSERRVRLNVNLWHRVAMDHIRDSIRASTSIIQHPGRSGCQQQQYRSCGQRRREDKNNTTEEPLPSFLLFSEHFQYARSHFIYSCADSLKYSYPKGPEVTFHVAFSQTIQSSFHCFCFERQLSIFCSKAS